VGPVALFVLALDVVVVFILTASPAVPVVVDAIVDLARDINDVLFPETCIVNNYLNIQRSELSTFN
jgi:hypothetical protein